MCKVPRAYLHQPSAFELAVVTANKVNTISLPKTTFRFIPNTAALAKQMAAVSKPMPPVPAFELQAMAGMHSPLVLLIFLLAYGLITTF
jgi:hypothetical protein